MSVGRVVIVGGGVAGVSTAAALRSGGFAGEVMLVDAGDYPYDRPPLSKEFLLGTSDGAAVALQTPDWYPDNGVDLRALTRVTRLDPGSGAVEFADGTAVTADRVVLATGGAAARPPISGADSERVHVLRTLDDARRLRDVLRGGARLLVVGAGLIGAEVASTAVDLGCAVTLLDPVAPPLVTALGDELAEWTHRRHRERGVTVVEAAVTSFADTAGGIAAHVAGEDAPREFDAVVLGVGMTPDTALAEAAGLDVDRGIVVDESQTTSNPSILAVGDPTRIRRAGTPAPRAEHWDAAGQEGRRAAATILGVPPPADTAPWFWTDRHGHHIEAVGSMLSAERVVRRGAPDAPASVFGLRDGLLVGAAAVDDSTAVRAARRMIDRGVRVDADRLADPDVDLRALLRGAKTTAAETTAAEGKTS